MEFRFENTGELIPRSLWKLTEIEPHEKMREKFLDHYGLANILFDEFTLKYNLDDLAYNLLIVVYERVNWKKLYKEFEKEFQSFWSKLPIDKNEVMHGIINLSLHTSIYNFFQNYIFSNIYEFLNKHSNPILYKSEPTDNNKINALIREINKFNKTIPLLVSNYVRLYSNVVYKANVSIQNEKKMVKILEEIKKHQNSRITTNLSKSAIEELEEIYLMNDQYLKENGRNNFKMCVKAVISKSYAGNEREIKRKIQARDRWMRDHKDIRTFTDFRNYVEGKELSETYHLWKKYISNKN